MIFAMLNALEMFLYIRVKECKHSEHYSFTLEEARTLVHDECVLRNKNLMSMLKCTVVNSGDVL